MCRHFRSRLPTAKLPVPKPFPALAQVFNILCEHPETVAAFLVPRARSVVAHRASGAAIRYLTPYRVLLKLLAAPFNIGRYFDAEGEGSQTGQLQRAQGVGWYSTGTCAASSGCWFGSWS